MSVNHPRIGTVHRAEQWARRRGRRYGRGQRFPGQRRLHERSSYRRRRRRRWRIDGGGVEDEEVIDDDDDDDEVGSLGPAEGDRAPRWPTRERQLTLSDDKVSLDRLEYLKHATAVRERASSSASK